MAHYPIFAAIRRAVALISDSALKAFIIFMRVSLFCLLCLAVMIASCSPESFTPKPRGYARLDTPQHSYQLFDRAGFPYAFEYPVYGHISQDSDVAVMKPDNPYWLNIHFPELGGTFYLSYKPINARQSLDVLLNESHDMSFWHVKRADYINTPVFHTPNNAHGILYDVGGNAASAYQFFATDSARHFIRGALYFNVTPNADSLKPVTDFLYRDMQHLINTLRWK